MTTMSNAIKDAGIAPTTNKRIWQWLKDNGPHTGQEVAVALNIKSSVSSSLLSQMTSRKMVSANKKHSEHSKRNVNYYASLGKVYVVLQVPKAVPKIIENQVRILDKIEPRKSKVEELLETLSVVDAFTLYERLDRMFNKKS